MSGCIKLRLRLRLKLYQLEIAFDTFARALMGREHFRFKLASCLARFEGERLRQA